MPLLDSSLHTDYSQTFQLLPDCRECEPSMRARQHAMRALDVPILLHQRERHRLIGDGGDWAPTLAVVPSDIEFIDGQIAGEYVPSGYDTLVGVTLQEELAAEEVALGISSQSRNLWCGEAHRQHFGAVGLGGEGHG
jgi:hypothetical protein